MGQTLTALKRRWKSDVPPVVKKAQILLSMAAGSLGTIALIPWPGKSAFIGELAGYGAAGCAGIAAAIQFIEKAVEVLMSDTPESQPVNTVDNA